MTYRIKDWDKHFETTESRKLKKLHWTAFPNKHDGSGYKMLWKLYPSDAVEVFCAFVLMVEVASKCPIRGYLINNANEPLTPGLLSLKTEAPEAIFIKAFKILPRLGWLEQISETSENLRNFGKSPYTLHNNTEHNITEPDIKLVDVLSPELVKVDRKKENAVVDGIIKEVSNCKDVIAKWNSLEAPFPKVIKLGKRADVLRARLKDKWWSENWEKAMDILKTLDFCKGKNDRGWVADIEFFLRPDSVAKLLEGKYRDQSKPTTHTPTDKYADLDPELRKALEGK